MSTATAKMMNDDMAGQQRTWPDRIRFYATLPWQYPDAAVVELARARRIGAVGVFVAANVSGASLTDERFQPIWKAIDTLSRFPALVTLVTHLSLIVISANLVHTRYLYQKKDYPLYHSN
jgi:aminocarboxymuconate-semialdehyde decarboxylase